jgi:outer membrane biosynthesis protein TonB
MIEDQGRGNGPLFVAAALVAMGIAYVLLLAHPGLVHGVSAVWHRLPGSGSAPGWALPAVAAGIAIGGTAIGVALLSAFVRGVQAHPFAWLAPVLVGFSTLVMTGLPIDLPWQSLSLRLFAVLAGLTMLGGGAVMQMRGLTSIVAGTLLLLLPMLVLIAGYAALPPGLPAVLSGLDASSQLFLFVLALTSVGIGFMAFVTERNTQDAVLMTHLRDQNPYVAEALEFAEAADARAAEAERRAQLAEQRLRAGGAGSSWGARAVSGEEAAAFAAMARPGLSTSAVVAGLLCVVAVVVAGLYAGVYRPLERRAEAQRKFVASAAAEHAAEIDGLRKHFQAQQASLEAVIAAERAKAGEAGSGTQVPASPAAATPTPAAAATPATPTPAAAPAPAAKPKPAAQPEEATAPAQPAAPAKVRVASERETRTAVRRASQRKSAAFGRAPRKSEISRAGAAATAKAVAEEPELDRETRRALRETIDDDPIGGLEQ